MRVGRALRSYWVAGAVVAAASACGGKVATSGATGGSGSVGAAGSGAASGVGAAGSGAASGVGAAGSGAAGGAGAAGSGAASGVGAAGFDFAACQPGDTCLLETQTTCGAGCEPIPPDRYIPINSKNEAAFKAQQLEPLCIQAACPAVPPEQVNAPNYYGACVAERCQVLDVRTSALSACDSDSQCLLREGTACCACSFTDLIAVTSQAEAQKAFCAPGEACASGCPYPLPPAGGAFCAHAGSGRGHCMVFHNMSSADAGL